MTDENGENVNNLSVADFDYALPEGLIAKYPLEKRDLSRLLCLNRKTGALIHGQFPDVISLISKNDLLVCNNTRVIPARLLGAKATGGRVEVLVERILNEKCMLAQVKASKSPKSGAILSLGVDFEVLGRKKELFILRAMSEKSILEVIEAIGHIPIPPYLNRQTEAIDKERYQTIYALHKGAVAAPTAGLHFDENLFKALREKGVEIAYVTLHVGAGTFAPVRVHQISEHRMHKEYMEVSASLCEKIKQTKARGGRVVAVGTTTVRSLETAAFSGSLRPFSGETDIFIYPGFTFQCVDAVITNFHLPQSTLLMLVSAFGGYENIKKAYQEAILEQYRFFSYGDAMWIG